MSFAYLEFLITTYFFPNYKNGYSKFFLWSFLPIASIGCFLRLSAFITARSNFHHLIRYRKEKTHKLITTGVYGLERHPGYLGYFFFSIFSQLTIKNFLSAILFTFVLWRFFLNRIVEEEHTLLRIFGEDYLEYKENVSTHIPFIGSLIDFRLKLRGVELKEYREKKKKSK